MAIPWAVIIPAVIAIVSELLEKSPEKKGLEMQETLGGLGMKPPFQNQYLPQMSEAAMRAVMAQLGRTQNWGWPAGKQQDTGWIQEMIGQIEPAIPAPVTGGVWNPTMGIRG